MTKFYIDTNPWNNFRKLILIHNNTHYSYFDIKQPQYEKMIMELDYNEVDSIILSPIPSNKEWQPYKNYRTGNIIVPDEYLYITDDLRFFQSYIALNYI